MRISSCGTEVFWITEIGRAAAWGCDTPYGSPFMYFQGGIVTIQGLGAAYSNQVSLALPDLRLLCCNSHLICAILYPEIVSLDMQVRNPRIALAYEVYRAYRCREMQAGNPRIALAYEVRRAYRCREMQAGNSGIALGDGKEGVVAFYLIEMFGISLGLTLVVELAVAFLFGLRSGREMLLALLVNVLTNPPAVLACWLLGMFFPELPRIWAQIPVECTVVILEASIYSHFAKEAQWEIRRPICLAVFANACSWLLGVLITEL